MSTGHTHTDAHGCDATHRLLCELFDADTAPERREEIKNDLASCPECLAVAQSERDVRAMVRECCGPREGPGAVAPAHHRLHYYGELHRSPL